MASTAAEPPAPAPAQKPIHSLCIDAGPLIKNDPTVSSLLARATEIYTLPSVLAELRDEATRHRVQTTLVPFLKLRTPRPASVSFITGFARRTGDLEVLSRPDIHLLALTYEIECERNGGDGRLRREPVRGGAAPAGAKPGAGSDGSRAEGQLVPSEPSTGQSLESGGETASAEATADVELGAESRKAERIEGGVAELSLEDGETPEPGKRTEEASAAPPLLEPPSQEPPEEGSPQEPPPAELSEENPDQGSPREQEAEDSDSQEADEDSDEGWITPSNIHRHKAADAAGPPASSTAAEETMQAAILTSDYAMQNVALRIGLHLVSPALMRVTHLKTWCLRCYGCFKTTRDMTRQFCPSCGQPTLTRTSCSVDADGRFTVHLKRNFQYNKRGNVYSIPKPVHGSASGKVTDHGGGGGQGGWGKGLILAEDQKEFVRAKEAKKREKARDLFDQDYLPDILTGQRAGGGGGKIKVGAGRSVNSRRRR